MTVEGGVQYKVTITAINEANEVEIAYVTPNDQLLYSANDKTLVLNDILWAPPYAGDFQFNLKVEALNRQGQLVQVCAGQSFVRTK
jgi:hypothetical protein